MSNQLSAITSQAYYTDQVFKEVNLDRQHILASEFVDCRFVRCSCIEANFNNCRFVSCTFQGCDLSLVHLLGSTLSATHFRDCKLIGVDWTQIDWTAPSLGKPVGFINSTLNHATFIGLALPGIEIRDCTAIDVDFREADLSQVDFSGTDLSESLFANTNLTAADLSRAHNYQIAPQENTIKQAKFSLPEAMSLLYNLDIELIDDL